MKTYPKLKKLALLSLVSFSMTAGLINTSSATVGTITKSDLSGSWRITLNGITGCGKVAMLADVTLNSTGSSTAATLTTHGECGDSTINLVDGAALTILSVNATGTGTANLSCGPGCGWNLAIQVAPDRAMFNLVDVDPANPGNFISGVAIHK